MAETYDQFWRKRGPQDITPGPWQALLFGSQACVIELAHRSQVAGYTRPADAVAMAATHELLAVAEEFRRLWAQGGDHEEAHARLAWMAEAAIAKARGPAYGRPWGEEA